MKFDPVDLDMIFETSWEVCNKIGGIYTVLSTKAQTLQDFYKDKVVFIGPDVWTKDNPSPYFTEVPSLLRPWRDKANLPEGVSVRVGRWNVPGKPITILVDFKGMFALKDYYYGEMWERFGVDSLHGYGDYDESCAFSLAAGAVIESICNYKRLRHKNVLAHFDEWTTGMGLLYIKWKVPFVGTIFTTHATSIGRSICGNGKPLYDYLHGYNGDQMAQELNMQSKHSLEKAAAHNADCFTTVSDVTAAECEQLLERRPDIVTPNGFPADWAPAKSKQKRARQAARDAMLNVGSKLCGYTLPEDTFIIATSGRAEYRNKGLDVFLDAAARLREMVPQRNLLLYILVPAWSKAPRTDLSEALKADAPKVEASANPGAPSKALPEPVITHELNNPNDDAIINRIRQLGFPYSQAHSDAKVQVVYVPCYLTGNDGILNMNYYDMLAGVDLTVFPSYYEPWGYTPLESVAFGVPTVTTSLSGFGQWVLSTSKSGFAESGVVVIPRNDSNYSQVVETAANDMLALSKATPEQYAADSAAARATADKAEWNYFITYYIDAFRMALAAADKRRVQA